MTTSGWIIMTISVGSVTALLTWCVFKVITIPEETKHVHGFEQKPPDSE
jgi:hypothetical protein